MNTLEQANKRIEVLETQLKRMKEQELLLVNNNDVLRDQIIELMKTKILGGHMAKETKAQLEYMNRVLDAECQKKMKEVELLKVIVSLLMKNDGALTKTFKMDKFDPLYVKIENDWCTIIREVKDGVEDAGNESQSQSES